MTDQELADKIVAFGIGEYNGHKPDGWRFNPGDGWYQNASEFICDWRVAGAMMEKCHDVQILIMEGESYHVMAKYRRGKGVALNQNEPRAINKACADALS